jgi:hypothetical protein
MRELEEVSVDLEEDGVGDRFWPFDIAHVAAYMT